MEELHAEADEPHIKIVRPSTRRKFLAAILGTGVILGLGAPALLRMAQNAQIAFNTKDGPPDSDLLLDSFSADLNLAAFVKFGVGEKLYIWSYQQQRMLTLPPAQLLNASAWSPSSRYLFYEESQDISSNSMNIWDIRAWQKVSSYDENENYMGADIACWSPNGSQIALFDKEENKLLLMAVQPLRPLFTLNLPSSVESFAWSPDSQKIALMIGSSDRSAWSIQIWDIKSRGKRQEIAFQGRINASYPSMAWSPDSTYIATCAHGLLQIIRVGGNLSSKLLDKDVEGRIAWSPDSKYLVIVGSELVDDKGWDTLALNGIFDVWSITTEHKVWSSSHGFNIVPRAVAWSKDGRKIITIENSYSQINWNWPL